MVRTNLNKMHEYVDASLEKHVVVSDVPWQCSTHGHEVNEEFMFTRIELRDLSRHQL